MASKQNSFVFIICASIFLAVLFNKIEEKCNEQGNQQGVVKYWPFVQVKWNKNDNLRTVKRVFDRLGHSMVNGSTGDDWEVMWSIEYPFELFSSEMKSLKPHQRVNHIPGINFITFKSFMATHNKQKFIPPAFEFPHMIEHFKNHVKKNPDKKFVQKNGDNRGVKIVSVDEINFEATSKGTFYQEFIENPLLIDGRAFDMGVYVLISSINPLRIYRFKSEVLLRFCPEPYHPFDAGNIDKYVVYESQKTIFEMPSLKEMCTKMGFSFKASFEAHMSSRSFDVEELWIQVDDAIVSLVLSNEQNLIAKAKEFGPTDHFFELVRFDFIIDDEFQVHLMEVNMSPNLTPAHDRFEAHGLGYEQVVFNTLQCVIGINSYSDDYKRCEFNVIQEIFVNFF